MGWTIQIQLVRDRPLDDVERAALEAHTRRYKLSRASEGYRFAVAPAGASGGVIALGGGKLARHADPGEDGDAARLYAALSELRTLVPDATLEVADDLHLVGRDGDRIGLVEDPDQELTPAPRDREAWLVVPARRARRAPAAKPAARKRASLPAPLDRALEAQLAGAAPIALEAIDDLRGAVTALFAALARATRAKDWPLREAVTAITGRLPALAVVEAGLDSPAELAGAASTAIGEAIARLPDPSVIRDRLLDIWLGPPPTRKPAAFWDDVSYPVLRPACDRDPALVDRLGADLLTASLEDSVLARRHLQTIWCLRSAPGGPRHLIRRRRLERGKPTPQLTGVLLDGIGEARAPEVVPTLLLELARRRDRDGLLRMLGRIDEPRVLPVLERALATDQYTRVVAEALLTVPGDRAEALLDGLVDHADPLVRIRAAHGLIGRRGAAAAPLLLAALAHARAAGIWPGDRSVGTWFNEQLGRLDDALERPPFPLRAAWPAELRPGVALPEVTGVEPSSSPARMLSPNPDVRRDAIELAHEAALAARELSAIAMLVRAQRLHVALCVRAGLAQTTGDGFCGRAHVTNYWSSWRKLGQLPFDPMYRSSTIVLDWLEQHAHQLTDQVIPPALAAITDDASALAAAEATPDRRLRFTPDEVAAWDAEELALLA